VPGVRSAVHGSWRRISRLVQYGGLARLYLLEERRCSLPRRGRTQCFRVDGQEFYENIKVISSKLHAGSYRTNAMVFPSLMN
jgi:hypothetical protein